MFKFVICLVLLLAFAAPASAQYFDDDGKLVAEWQPPTYGNPVAGYLLKYEINSVVDSVVVFTTALADSTVALLTPGDSALVRVQAISVFSDTSSVVTSDVAYYKIGTGIGPINGLIWKP